MPIIFDSCDLIGELPHWKTSSDEEALKRKSFNDRVSAVTLMYRYLQENSILQKISDRYDEGTSTNEDNIEIPWCHFCFDSESLVPYRHQMESSGVKDAELACKYIFGDEGYVIEPCFFCGAISPSWVQNTYRNNCGTIGRSWEATPMWLFCSRKAYDVFSVLKKNGALAASTYAYDKLANEYVGSCSNDVKKEMVSILEEIKNSDKKVSEYHVLYDDDDNLCIVKVAEDIGNYSVSVCCDFFDEEDTNIRCTKTLSESELLELLETLKKYATKCN